MKARVPLGELKVRSTENNKNHRRRSVVSNKNIKKQTSSRTTKSTAVVVKSSKPKSNSGPWTKKEEQVFVRTINLQRSNRKGYDWKAISRAIKTRYVVQHTTRWFTHSLTHSLNHPTHLAFCSFFFTSSFRRDAIQVKSHAQWYFKKQDKKSESKQTSSFLDLTDDGNEENTTHHSHLLAASPIRVKNETVPNNTRTPVTLTTTPTQTPQRDFPFAGFLCSCVHDGHECGEYYVNVGAKDGSSSSQNSNKRYYSQAEMDTIFSLANLPLSS